MISAAHIASLRRRFSGDLIDPGHAEFAAARRVWNGMIDRRPGLIARCACAEDVAAAVDWGRELGLTLAVRGGGHNVAGFAVCDGGLVIDLSRLRAVEVDPRARVARVAGGATWGDFDRATQAYGLASTGGEVSSTGVAGLTLGGGIGWLMGRCGLACDNLRAVELIDAGGQRLRASRSERPELLWALCGGGGNFGVVTQFEIALHEIGSVIAGPILFPAASTEAFLARYAEWTAGAPDELTMMAMLVAAADGTPMVGAFLVHCGAAKAAERWVDQVRAFAPALVDDVRARSYGELQAMLDPTAPAGRRNYWKASFVKRLEPELIRALHRGVWPLRSVWSSVLIEHLHGAVTRVPADATAFGLREECYSIGIFSVWGDPADDALHTAWAGGVAGAIAPWATAGAYINYLGADGTAQARASYGTNYPRLVDVKRRYDPHNVFRLNHNIGPE
jgi:FAD/FMN-containing dehydrogenase